MKYLNVCLREEVINFISKYLEAEWTQNIDSYVGKHLLLLPLYFSVRIEAPFRIHSCITEEGK